MSAEKTAHGNITLPTARNEPEKLGKAIPILSDTTQKAQNTAVFLAFLEASALSGIPRISSAEAENTRSLASEKNERKNDDSTLSAPFKRRNICASAARTTADIPHNTAGGWNEELFAKSLICDLSVFRRKREKNTGTAPMIKKLSKSRLS